MDLNRRLAGPADGAALRPGADLSSRVPLPDPVVKSVLVGHGFANTGTGGCGAGLVGPPTVTACGVGQGSTAENSILTPLATATIDAWDGPFAPVPPVRTAAATRPGERLSRYLPTPEPARIVVLRWPGRVAHRSAT